uniref:Uncharacterized protein n=1 Tax=Pseudomonas fluorescens (strain SBW25) TaxID=216595 RepID=A0A0G4E663_PSEFS|nr:MULTISPECIES: hypothetical protein [Pseudomonas]CAD13467.1 hypothetical protein [Pseudomonas sp. SLT2001]CEK42432.1 hypothetical protein PQBR55_0053 [Pseudomonas fluorescens SBW25]
MDLKKSSNVAVFTTADGVGHTMIVGGSDNAKSALLMAEARRRGISYEDLLQPSPEQIEADCESESISEAQKEKCLAAVCEAYWANSPLESTSLQQLHDTLVVAELSEEPTPEQVKALLMLLPAHIVGQGIAWGFEDTDVRDQVYEYVLANMDAVTAAISVGGQKAES